MCRSCRCGRAGAGADGWEMRTGGTRSSNRGAGEQQAGMEGRPELEARTEERASGKQGWRGGQNSKLEQRSGRAASGDGGAAGT